MTSEFPNSPPPPPPPQERGTDADEQVTDRPSAKKAWHKPTFTVIDGDMKIFKSGAKPDTVVEDAVYYPLSG